MQSVNGSQSLKFTFLSVLFAASTVFWINLFEVVQSASVADCSAWSRSFDVISYLFFPIFLPIFLAKDKNLLPVTNILHLGSVEYFICYTSNTD